MAMNQKQAYHTFSLDNNEDYYNAVSAIVRCVLSDCVVGWITEEKLQNRSDIISKGGGGGGGTPPYPPSPPFGVVVIVQFRYVDDVSVLGGRGIGYCVWIP